MNHTDQAHPIERFALRLVQVAASGVHSIDARAERRLTEMLVEHGDDPAIPSVVLFLFELATTLFEQPRSEAAALVILKALAEARPHLPGLKAATGKLADRLETVERRAGELPRAPAIDEPVPEGSLKASAFLNPGRQPLR